MTAMVHQYTSMSSQATNLAWARASSANVASQWRYRLTLLLLLLSAGIALTHVARQDSPFALYGHAPTWHTHRVVTTRSDTDKQTPPAPPRVFNDTVESIKKLGKKIVDDEVATVNNLIKKIKPEDATFENVVLPYLQHENRQMVEAASIYLYPGVGVDSKLMDACTEINSNLDDVYANTTTSPELFALVDAVYKKQVNDTTLETESRSAIENFLSQFQSSGFGVPAGPKRKRLKDIDSRLHQLNTEFGNEADNDNTTLYFTPTELEGVDKDFLNGLEKGKGEYEGKLVVPMVIYENVENILNYCKNDTSRYAVLIAYNNMAPSNIARLQEAIAIRHEKAQISGYPNFATLKLQGTMAKTPMAVDDFLQNLLKRLTIGSDEEIAEMKKLEVKAGGKAEEPLYLWREYFYETQLAEDVYKVDNQFIKEYFEAIAISQAILDMYAEIYSLHYVKVEGDAGDKLSPTGKGSDLVWHPDVQMYEVWNNEKDMHYGAPSQDFIGYIYIDLYHRDGKGSGSFENPIDPGFTEPDGSRHHPTTTAVLNIKKSETDKPTLLLRDDVRALMHELGHVTHHMVSKTKYSRFHGPGFCPPDFVELPSQLMENWAYNRLALKRLSKHYSYLSPKYHEIWQKDMNDSKAVQPPEKLTDKVIDDIIKNKNAVSAYARLVQTMYSMFDMAIHEPKSEDAAKAIDTTVLWNQLRSNITHVVGPEAIGKGWKWGHRPSIFTHFMGGYEAGYYGYSWSRVDAADVFYTAFKDSPFNSTAGSRWRHIVLEPGSTKDFITIVEEFLGHKRNDDAFFEDLDIKKSTANSKGMLMKEMMRRERERKEDLVDRSRVKGWGGRS